MDLCAEGVQLRESKGRSQAEIAKAVARLETEQRASSVASRL